MKELPIKIKQELMPIVCALGFLSVYAHENEKEEGHPVYSLMKDLTNIVKLYRSRYTSILDESFDIFDEIVDGQEVLIDTIAFANALLVFHRQHKKMFHPNQNKVKAFWIEYKKQMKNDGKERLDVYKSSRDLATKFMRRITNET